jgi:hypothetical protein
MTEIATARSQKLTEKREKENEVIDRQILSWLFDGRRWIKVIAILSPQFEFRKYVHFHNKKFDR